MSARKMRFILSLFLVLVSSFAIVVSFAFASTTNTMNPQVPQWLILLTIIAIMVITVIAVGFIITHGRKDSSLFE